VTNRYFQQIVGTSRRSRVKEIPRSEAKNDLSHLLRQAEKQDIVITRHGKPAAVLIGFESEDDWFEYRLQNDPCFLRRVERARKSLRWPRRAAGGCEVNTWRSGDANGAPGQESLGAHYEQVAEIRGRLENPSAKRFPAEEVFKRFRPSDE
jgi:prevent-host-death family protein